MALADDPRAHIIHMFKMEMRAAEDHKCEIFPEGCILDDIPLISGEKVFGVYKRAFYFTPDALIWIQKGNYCRLDWRQVVSCSTEHGSGDSRSVVQLADGTKLTVPIGELSKGWSGRVGQLYHAMITRWRRRVRDDHYIYDIDRFFKVANRYDAIAPNWYPSHPGLAQMQSWLEGLRDLPSSPEVFLIVTDYDGNIPCVQEIALLSRAAPIPDEVSHLAFSYYGPSHKRTLELFGAIPDGYILTSGVWD
jgi:hypothetical protein